MKRTVHISFRVTSRIVLFTVTVVYCVVSCPTNAHAARHRYAVEDPKRRTELNGKTIRSIKIVVKDIFDHPKPGSFYEIVNGLKVPTKRGVVLRELLFHEGDRYDEFRIEETERNLRGLGFFATAQIIPIVEGNTVDLEVRCRDTWTFIPEFSDSTGTGRTNLSAGIAEKDLLGNGKRLEFLYSEKDNRNGVQGVYDDQRLFGGKDSFVGGYFQRADGHEGVFDLAKPYRSLNDRESWDVNGDFLNTDGRLFKDGLEDYIYRQKRSDLETRYSLATGSPDTRVRRFSIGYNYTDDRFYQAQLKDYQELDLDPATVSNSLSRLPHDRRFSGPLIAYEVNQPEYISLNYIDRFERVQDFNIGDVFSAEVQAAAQALGSRDDAAILDTHRTRGFKFSQDAFVRGEVGVNTRVQDSEFQNTLGYGQVKFYQTFNPRYWDGLYLGRHTFAFNGFLDYGDRLDLDRQLLEGSDYGLRGYEAKTFSGNKSVGINVEDRIHFVDDLYRLISVGGAFFLDAGGVSDDALGTLLSKQIYSDVGFGVRFAFPRSSGGQVVRIDIAFPLRDGPDGSVAGSPRLLLQGAQFFDSQTQSEIIGARQSNIQVGVDR